MSGDNTNNGIKNESFVNALLKFNSEKTIENQDKLIMEMGKSKFLVPVTIKGNIKDGVLEKNAEIQIKIMADNNNNLFYAIFTDWECLSKFSKEKEDAIAVSYKEIRDILKMDKENITGVVINPSIYEKDFIMTERIMQDIDVRLEKLKTDFKAVIFDLDGTLADSLESIAYSANRAIEAFGYKPFEVERFKRFAGDGADTLIKRCLKESGDTELKDFEKAFEKYKELFKVDCMYKVKPYDGIVELLEKLKENNVKLAVLSNKPQERTEDVIKALFGDKLFDMVLGHSDKRAKKPSPEGAIYIAEKFGVSAEECVYVGDTNTDMKTGKSAGMFTVGVTWGFRDSLELFENGADKIINKPMEILELFN